MPIVFHPDDVLVNKIRLKRRFKCARIDEVQTGTVIQRKENFLDVYRSSEIEK